MSKPKWGVITAEGLWGTYNTEQEAQDVCDRFVEGAAFVLTPDEVGEMEGCE